MGSGDMEHLFYTRLVNDLAIYGIDSPDAIARSRA